MTFPVSQEPESSMAQSTGTYPHGTPAALPEALAPYNCDHDADPPICICVHDWRINWGNKPRVMGRRATYVSS